VSGDNSRRPFRILADGVQNISDVIRIIELRLGIEIEAAGLAAERRTDEDMKLIDDTVDQFGLLIKQGDEAVEADFNIHQAIAKATHNQHFVTFLDFLGWQIIPRRSIYARIVDHSVRRKYLLRVHNEHKSIAKAISDSRPNAARNAMRRHLEKSLKRYISIADEET